MEDLKLKHAREITDIEDGTLDLWLQLENMNLDDNAARVLDAGLMWEHYTSLLDNDPNQRTQAEIVQAAALETKFQTEVIAARAAMRRKAMG